jgi:rhamnose transport system substrate-binding protein
MRRTTRAIWARTLAASLSASVLGVAALSPSASANSRVKHTSSSFTVDFIQTQTGIPYDNAMISGVKQESARLGISYMITGPAVPGSSAQIPDIQQAIVKHVGAILINPDSPTAILPALREAKAAGIKIVEINDNSLPESVRVAGVTALNYALVPAAQMALLGQLMNYSGDFAVLSASSTSVFQNQVIAGYEHLLKTDPKYKNMHLVKIAYGNDESALSANQTTALLTEFPHLKAITSPTTVGLAAAAQAIESAHKAKKIIITGLGEPIEMKKFILDGTVKEYQLWNPTPMGIIATYIAYEASKGVSFPPGKRFSVPGSALGTLTVASDGNVWSQKGLTTFNLSNVNKYNF